MFGQLFDHALIFVIMLAYLFCFSHSHNRCFLMIKKYYYHKLDQFLHFFFWDEFGGLESSCSEFFFLHSCGHAFCLPPFSLTHTYTLTHSSNYSNQQADPISVSCLLSPRGWLPDHLTLHNLICNDRVWHPDFWPYQQLVCVYVFVCMCETC